MSSLIPDSEILDVSSVKRKLKASTGQKFWRSLNQLSGTPAFRRFVESEFPTMAGPEDVDRRSFMKLMGASMALAGMTGCTKQPKEHIVPYVKQPEEYVPGKPLFYATALTAAGYGTGLLIESHTGRPTKIEGNPEHPASQGATDARTQARILELYDPDRSQIVKYRGRISTWDMFISAMAPVLSGHQADGGEGLRLLTGALSSPTAAAQIEAFKAKFPKARWHVHEPESSDNALAGTRLAFGEALEAQYNLKDADVIVSLDADMLNTGPDAVSNAQVFASRRDVADHHHAEMNRLYVLECTPTVTGAAADHRLALSPSDLAVFAQQLAAGCGVALSNLPGGGHRDWVSAIAADLKAHLGRCLVVAGREQPPAIHALAHAMNQALGAVGRTVQYTRPVLASVAGEPLADLAADMHEGRVKTLITAGVNPVYNAPADLKFENALKTVPTRVHMGLFEDETARQSHWHLPEAHELESWGDVRAFDGTVTIQQPMILPLYGGKSRIELFDILLGKPGRKPYDVVKAHWEAKKPSADFDAVWKTAIHDGHMPGTALERITPRAADVSAVQATLPAAASGLSLVLRADPCIGDGSMANNGWLQELPKPLSKITWENALLISPALGRTEHLADGDIVTLTAGKRQVEVPVWTVPGHPANAVTLYLGYGRTRAGKVGSNIGVSAYALQSSDALWHLDGVTIAKTGRSATLACTQDHQSMEGRNHVRSGTLDTYKHNHHFVHDMDHHPAGKTSMYPDYEYKGYKWGMVIDLNSCIGCNACTVACQSENNIVVVGKDQVTRGREMHWIRVDRYFEGEVDEPSVHHQPVPCMHCEQAPCEPVCPVGATVHSDEGLNDMVYNRCVGTRYCSNNCPYKVRRFNFYHYNDDETESLKLQRNPNVTVRMRGVMEKCTYCVQRINAARITANNEGRKIKDGEVVTACQQACPTRAITFGDLNDPESRVSKLSSRDLNYALLGELGVRPRTTYLAKLSNPNPALVPHGPGDDHHGHDHHG